MRAVAPQERRRSRRPTALIALGLLGLAVFVIATLPASLVVDRLARFGVQADAVGGTVWSGRALGLMSRGTLIGDAQWSLRPLALLRGALAGHAVLVAGNGRAESDFVRSWSGRLELAQTRAEFPLGALAGLRLPIGRGWNGRVVADLTRAVFEDNWPVSAIGSVELHELVAPPPRSAALGSFQLAFPDVAPSSTGQLRALVTQTDGPLTFDGSLELGADRSFLLDGRIAPRGPPSREIAALLQALGPPEADGKRRFSVSGTL